MNRLSTVQHGRMSQSSARTMVLSVNVPSLIYEALGVLLVDMYCLAKTNA